MNDTLSVLNGFLASIPSFWSAKELAQVVGVYLDLYASSTATGSDAMLSLMKAIAKQAPTKNLLITLHELWPSLPQNVCYITPSLDTT
jgi:ABC-type dipeptide/oligopeptide/nickel transport system permease component